MSDDPLDKAAAAERAARLRAEIEKLTKGGPAPAGETPKPRSPREFIHDRMRELDKADKKAE